MMRAIIDTDPFIGQNTGQPSHTQGNWPCHWVCCPDARTPPFVTAFRNRFTLEHDATIRAHVSADERYELFLDGVRIGRGSERGDPTNWFYETYDLSLEAGEHVLVARVWSLGMMSPVAQMTVHPGFIFAPEGEFTELLGTGIASWDAKRLAGYSFVDPHPTWGTGHNLIVDARMFSWGYERGEGDNWQPVEVLAPGAGRMTGREFPYRPRMQPATLPPMMEVYRVVGGVRYVGEIPSSDCWGTAALPVHMENHLVGEVQAWTKLIRDNQAITIPPDTARSVIVDLEDYYCAYPEVVASGGAGAVIRVLWDESLRAQPDAHNQDKGHRDQIEGKYFVGPGDTFLPDGGQNRYFDTLWWQAGRYGQIIVQTADEPLTIERIAFRETRYPLEMESVFTASDSRLTRIMPILVRGMQMCAHETYMDCPYYEQLMYVGDTRLEVLTTYVMTRDDRLPRKALRLFDSSRLASGLTQARYPNRKFQVIPPFSLWWVAMVRDYALWRDDLGYVRSFMPGVRAVIEGYRQFLDSDGLVHAPEGWNFMDWVPEWDDGIPPDGADGVSGLLNWHFFLCLTMVADLEAMFGEQELATRTLRLAADLSRRLELFWDEKRGLYADDLAKQHFSEHTQCLAILSGQLDPQRRARVGEVLLSDHSLQRTTIYFTHYLFEAYRELGRIDALLDRLGLWYEQADLGAKTPFEKPAPTRSDCHAWGSHPLYHYFATILGIRPSSPGFATVEIRPQLGSLTDAAGTLVHPQGEIEVDFRVEGGVLHGHINLPDGIGGTLIYAKQAHTIEGGQNSF